MVKVLPHVMRNINEFNIPAENSHGYEILYFGVNLILMFDYRLSFDVEVKSPGNDDDKIEVLIISRKDIPAWKSSNFINNNSETKTVEVTLIHTWQQEIKESQLKNM